MRRLLGAATAAALLVTGAAIALPPPAGAVSPPIVNAPSAIPRLLPIFALRKATTPPIAGGATVSHIMTADPAERAGLRADGWQLDSMGTTNCDGIMGYLFDRPVTWPTGSTIAVHRFYNPAFNGYFLNFTEDAQIIANLAQFGFADQGIIGYGFSTADLPGPADDPTYDPAALKSYMNTTTNEQYYSANAAPAISGFTLQGTAGFVRPAGPASTDPSVPETPPAAAQLCPVSMLTKTIDGVPRHFATTKAMERVWLLATGWTIEATDQPASADGVVGYLWDRQIPGTDPVYRFHNDAFKSYYYESIAGNAAQRVSDLAQFGFVSEGVMGWDFATPQPGTAAWTYRSNPAGAAYYSTTAAGAAYAAGHGYTTTNGPVANLLTSADLPTPYYDIHRPAGTSRGVVVYIHGGGWQAELPFDDFAFHVPVILGERLAAGDATAPGQLPQRLVGLGWTVYSVDYHSGGAISATDVDWFMTRLRSLVGPGTKVCTAGGSAGGHLALLTAARRRDVACTVSLAGPTDLAADAAASTGVGPIIERGFGPDTGTVWHDNSPAQADLGGVTTKVLMAAAENDGLVPPSQMTLMGNALTAAGAPSPTIVTLAAGTGQGFGCASGSAGFIHACATQAAYDAYLATETAFMNGV